MERSKLVSEIVGARDKLVDCGVPKVCGAAAWLGGRVGACSR